MHTATERLVDAHLAACCEPDPAQRHSAVRDLWNATGRLVDPPLESAGHGGIADQGALLLAQFPGHRFVRTTQVDAHHEFVRYGWRLESPPGAAVLEGVDVMELDVDGRIGRVVGFFGAQPPVLA
jgi:hypothetical protein